MRKSIVVQVVNFQNVKKNYDKYQLPSQDWLLQSFALNDYKNLIRIRAISNYQHKGTF